MTDDELLALAKNALAAAISAAEARVREECAKIALYQGHLITVEMIRAGGGR